MTHRLLHRQKTRGGEGNAALHRCEERRKFRLLKMFRRMLRRVGLNVTSNGILLDSFFTAVSRALLRVRNLTYLLYFFLLIKRSVYPLLIKCVVSSSERVLKNSFVQQILLSRRAMLNGIEFAVRWATGLFKEIPLFQQQTSFASAHALY